MNGSKADLRPLAALIAISVVGACGTDPTPPPRAFGATSPAGAAAAPGASGAAVLQPGSDSASAGTGASPSAVPGDVGGMSTAAPAVPPAGVTPPGPVPSGPVEWPFD